MKKLPLAAKINIAIQQKLSFSPLFGRVYQSGKSSIGFFPGCSMSEYDVELTLKVYSYLQELFPGIALVTLCCAEPSRTLSKNKYQHYSNALKQRLRDYGITKLIVCCPNCQKNFSALTDVEIITLWEILEHNAPAQTNYYQGYPLFMLHDPCPCRQEIKTQDNVRSILNRLNFPYQEYSQTKGKTICCGKKDMLMIREPQVSKQILTNCVNRSDNKHIISYCFSCITAFRSAGCTAIHLLEAIFTTNTGVDSAKRSLIRSWTNRLVLLKRVRKALP